MQISMVSSGAKNMLEMTGITDQIAPQGTAQTTAIASIRCPQLSMTLVPQVPPMVHPNPMRTGHIALPCKPSLESTPSN